MKAPSSREPFSGATDAGRGLCICFPTQGDENLLNDFVMTDNEVSTSRGLDSKGKEYTHCDERSSSRQ